MGDTVLHVFNFLGFNRKLVAEALANVQVASMLLYKFTSGDITLAHLYSGHGLHYLGVEFVWLRAHGTGGELSVETV